MKLEIIAMLFSGGESENIPPTYKTIKKPKMPMKTVIKEITGINHVSFDCEKLEKSEDCGLFLNAKISFIRYAIININGAVTKIS